MKLGRSVNLILKGIKGSLIAVGLVSLTQTAIAQDSDDGELEEITVLGSATGTSIRGVAPVGSPVIDVSQDDLRDSVFVDTTDHIKNLPQGSRLAPAEIDDQGGNTGFAQGVNLRGLGRNATLVLFDGHRLVGQGVTESFADPNQLPVSAIERVEIVTDAASSIYGSDAVAGVVNYILKRDFDGVEVNLRHSDSLFTSTTVDAIAGISWDSGNAWIGAMYEDRGTFLRSESPYLSDDLTPFGGTNESDGVGPLAYIQSGSTLYTVPDLGGAIPTFADLIPGYEFVDSATYSSFQPERERLAVSARFTQDFLDDRARVSFTGIYAHRESSFDQFNTFDAGTVRSTSPYFIADFPGTSYTLGYSFAFNNQGPGSVPVINSPDSESLNLYLDFSYDFSNDWQVAIGIANGETTDCGRCGLRPQGPVFDAGLSGSGTYDGTNLVSDIFNPYLVGTQTQFFEEHFRYQNQEAIFDRDSYTIKADGPVLDLPAGELRIAVGFEHDEQALDFFLPAWSRTVPLVSSPLRDTESSRDVDSMFVEAYIPVTDKLVLSASIRQDDYSDFGSTTNPRFAFTFDATDTLSFRGSYGQAFRAPTLTETDPGVLRQFRAESHLNDGSHDIPVTHTVRGDDVTAVVRRLGSTPGLLPEEADVFSLGVDYANDAGLRGSLTYYNVEYSNRIENLPAPNTALINSQNRGLYSPYVDPITQPATCVDGDSSTYHPTIQAMFDNPDWRSARGTYDDCWISAVIRGGQVNLGDVNQSGVDLMMSYNWDTSFGDLSAAINIAKIIELEKSFVPGAEMVDFLDRIGEQNDLRATATLRWNKDFWGASVGARYTDGYTNDLPSGGAPISSVPSWTTVGGDFFYSVPEGEGDGFLDGMRIGLSFDNLFDRDPPVVLTSRSTRAVDLANHSIFGRTVSLSVRKKF